MCDYRCDTEKDLAHCHGCQRDFHWPAACGYPPRYCDRCADD